MLLLSVVALPSHATPANDWLTLQTQVDGSLGNDTDISTSYQSTIEVLRTFNQANVQPQPTVDNAIQFITNDTYHSTEYLSQKIIINAVAGNDTAAYITELRTYQYRNGGFGELKDFDSTPLDTAYALSALTAINDISNASIPMAVTYLINAQNNDGGWDDGNNLTSVYTTALVLDALNPYRTIYIGVADAITNAHSYLLTQQSSGLWATEFESALALIALTNSLSDTSVLNTSIDALQAQQLANGSWSNDTYITALAERAITLFSTQAADISDTTANAGISGTVSDANSSDILAGATVTLLGQNNLTTTTNSNGAFSITGISSGTHTLVVEMAGYHSVSSIISLNAGEVLNISTIAIYPNDAPIGAPTTLTLYGSVNSGLTGEAISNASIEVVETGEIMATNSQGEFVVNGLLLTSFQLNISATGFNSNNYTINVSAFGEVAQDFVLSPTVTGDPAVTTTTLTGVVTDDTSGDPIANATVSVQGTAIITNTDSLGQYSLANISTLEFDMTVSALGYQSGGGHITLNNHSTYTLDQQLTVITIDPVATSAFQVLSVDAQAPLVGSNTTAIINASIGNLTDMAQTGLIIGEVINASGESIATLTPYAPGTIASQSEFVIEGQQVLSVQIPWHVAHASPGSYEVIVRVVEQGTITAALPMGNVLAQNSSLISVSETYAIDGVVSNDPPLVQSDAETPVNLSALIINDGNVDLIDEPFELTITDPDTGAVLHSVIANAAMINAGQHNLVAFGSWIPTTAGDLVITIHPGGVGISGQVTGNLYVGDKATASFTLDQNVVADGTQTVHATIALQGVDTATATSSDPLFFAVKDAVERGGEYVAREGVSWYKRNRCLGCHVQSQSIVGLGTSMDKASIDINAAKTLLSTLTSSLHDDGGIDLSNGDSIKTQTALAGWALTEWPNKEEIYRTLYKAAKFSYDRRSQDSQHIWFTPDNNGGWWSEDAAQTALMAKMFAEVVRGEESDLVTSVPDYELLDIAPVTNGLIPYDMEAGPDGKIYILTNTGEILTFDPSTNTMGPAIGAFSSRTHDIAIADDGTIYGLRFQTIVRLNQDGSLTVVADNLGVSRGLAVDSENNLYTATGSDGPLYKIAPDGSKSVLINRGGFREPHDVAIGDDGNIYIPSYANFNTVKYDNSTGEQSLVAEGINFRPERMTRDNQGGFYLTTSQAVQWRTSLLDGLYYIAPDGVSYRLASKPGLRSVAVVNGRVFIANTTDKTLYELKQKPLDPTVLTDIKSATPYIADYFLSNYLDNTTDNVIQAMRLTGLAELRSVTTDSAKQAQIDEAINYIADLLWSRQLADGSWGQLSTDSGDPMMSAFVGIALDYTNPSARDPRVRNTIEYLLNTQASDNTWPSYNRLFLTRFASTSLVMAYMPKALARLGGLSVDLNVSMPTNIQLTNLSNAATSETANTTGGIDYLWQLSGVTSQERTIEFDLTLENMLINEIRPAASSAFMVFNNSFTGEPLQVGIDIPSVKAVSELNLGLDTGKSSYQASEDVMITATVDNVATIDVNATLQLSIRSVGATSALAILDPIAVATIPANGQIAVSAQWNTANNLVGSYEVIGQLINANGQVASENILAFDIVHMGNVVNSNVTTDKPVYQAWDSVAINTRVQNISANTIQPATFTELTVKDPLNNTLLFTTATHQEMQPNALRDVPQSLLLTDAIAGLYNVEFVVKDDTTRTVITTSNTSFTVDRIESQSLIGAVTATPRAVYVGETIRCDETISNRSSSDLTGITLTRQLIDMTSEAIINEATLIVDMVGSETLLQSRDVDTGLLAVGAYMCRLTADIGGQTTLIGAAGFDVTVPPIVIDSTIEQGNRGRLLVLLDDMAAVDYCGAPTELGLVLPMSTSIATDATITVELRDGLGVVIDTETMPLDTITFPLNVNPIDGIDLKITDWDGAELSLSYTDTTGVALNGNYQVTTTISSSVGDTVYDSGAIQLDCAQIIAMGDSYGPYSVSAVILPSSDTDVADPHGPLDAPSLNAQRFLLEQTLTANGWIYTIVTNADSFASALRSGNYVSYAVLSEQVKLDEQVQKEVREAVYRGAGLLIAGSHDNRNHTIFDAAGVKVKGKHPATDGADIQSIDLQNSGSALSFIFDEKGLKVDVLDATVSGYFTNASVVTTDVSATTSQYGNGRSVFIGFDLLAQATAEQGTGNYTSLLQNALVQIQPAILTPIAGGIVPVHVNLTNLGIAVQGQVVIALPAGAQWFDIGNATTDTDGALHWTYDMAVDATARYTVWVRMPMDQSAIHLMASIQTGAQTGTTPDFTDYGVIEMDITPVAQAALTNVITELTTYIADNGKVDKGYDRALAHLQKADSDLISADTAGALSELISTVDDLISIPETNAAQLRLKVDQVIGVISRTL